VPVLQVFWRHHLCNFTYGYDLNELLRSNQHRCSHIRQNRHIVSGGSFVGPLYTKMRWIFEIYLFNIIYLIVVVVVFVVVVIVFIVCSVSFIVYVVLFEFGVLFVCCVLLYHCHRVKTHLQFK
jgi:hypothetical protein